MNNSILSNVSSVCFCSLELHSHEDLIAKEEIQDSYTRRRKEKEKIQDSCCSNVYQHTSMTAGNVICSSLVFVKISLDYPGGIIDRVH